MPREDLLLSRSLRLASHTISAAEVCWRRRDFAKVIHELASRNVVILGFDILTLEGPNSAVRLWGTSAYDMKDLLRTRPWNECVKLSLEKAEHDLNCPHELTLYTGNLDDLWYCPITMQWGEPIYP